jgi:uncharacterized protein YbaR (Trm112 family)
LLPKSLEGLVCPRSHEPFIYFPCGPDSTSEVDACLVAPGARLLYRIVGGVPCLLVEEAVELSPDEAARLVAQASALGLHVPA